LQVATVAGWCGKLQAAYDPMTLTSDQFKTVIVELGAPENPILDTKITTLTCLGADI